MSRAAVGGLGDITADELLARINQHADLAVAQARLDRQAGLIGSTPQAFGVRAHSIFESWNKQLGSDLIDAGSEFRLSPEEYRHILGNPTFAHAPGSIGADLRITSIDDPSFVRVFDLKTYTVQPIFINTARQNLFQQRLGAYAQEIFRQQ